MSKPELPPESRPTLAELKKRRERLVNELAFVEAGIKEEGTPGRADQDAIMGRIKNGLRSIEHRKSDPEDAQGVEYELWYGVLQYYALGGAGAEAALEVMRSREIDFPRWLP